MTEMQKIWLEQLYQNEIEEVVGTIANEIIWAKGSTGEDREMHKDNIEELKEYKALLKEMIKELK